MHYDVTVIGYGPVGALTALSLAHAGLRVLILDRATEPAELPRAVGLDGETLRALQRLGLGEEVEKICQPPRDPNEIRFTNSQRETIVGLDIPAHGPNGWCDILFFDQPELEVALRGIVARSEQIDVRLGHEVVAIEQDTDAVTTRCSVADSPDPEAAVAFVSSFAIGCDGASSFVRKALGIGWQSLGYDQDWLVVDVVQGPDANLPLATMQVCDPERLTSYICTKDPYRRWEFQLVAGETREEMLAPEKIRELLDPWTARENYEIRRAAVYQFHAATADDWRVGRVFLAGDAAHQTPPFLGQGLNAGFRDAVNLGWKIPLVLAGRCDAGLLDSYADERDDHARALVERAVSVGKMMETLAAREAGRPDPHPPESIGLDVNAPIVPPMRGGILIAEQCDAGHKVGQLLQQPVVREPHGPEQRLDELLGGGLSIVGREPGDLVLGPEASAILDRLGGRCVALEGLEVVKGAHDALFDRYATALIRPDRYVFGVVDAHFSLDRLVVEYAARMRLLG